MGQVARPPKIVFAADAPDSGGVAPNAAPVPVARPMTPIDPVASARLAALLQPQLPPARYGQFLSANLTRGQR